MQNNSNNELIDELIDAAIREGAWRAKKGLKPPEVGFLPNALGALRAEVLGRMGKPMGKPVEIIPGASEDDNLLKDDKRRGRKAEKPVEFANGDDGAGE